MLFRNHRRIVSMLVAFALLITSVQLQGIYAKAEMQAKTKNTGIYNDSSITYTYYKGSSAENSYLIFEGSGELPDISQAYDDQDTFAANTVQADEQPWLTAALPDGADDSIKKAIMNDDTNYPLGEVVFGENITSLGKNTFANYDRATVTLRIGKNLRKFPEQVFEDIQRLNIYIYGTESLDIDENAFKDMAATSSKKAAIYVASEDIKAQLIEKISLSQSRKEEIVIVDEKLKIDSTPLYLAVAKAEIEKDFSDNNGDGRYTTEKWSALTTALDAGKEALEGTFSSEEEVKEKTDAINNAMDALTAGSNGFIENLFPLIEEAEGLTEEDYTPNSWLTLQQALATAKTLNGESESSAVTGAVEALSSALEALVSIKGLNAKIAEAAEIESNKDSCTKSTYDPFEAALTAARNVADDATQDIVNQLLNTLTEKMEAVVILDLSTLKTYVGYYKADRETNNADEKYTAESWQTFADAYDAAYAASQSAYESGVESQDDLESLRNAMMESYRNLVEDPEAKNAAIQALQEKLDEVEAALSEMSEEDYTPQSWRNLQTVLTQVRSALADSANRTTSSFTMALTNLQAAFDGLQLKFELKDDEYFVAEGTWQKGSGSNQMAAVQRDVEEPQCNAAEWQLQIAYLDLTGIQSPMIEVIYEANGDTLQIVASDTEWTDWGNCDVITNGTESSGRSRFALDKKYTYIMVSSKNSSLVVNKVRIYDGIAELAEAREALAAAREEAEGLNEGDYTAETWQALQEALAAADNLPGDAAAAELEAAAKAIQDAIEALKKPGEPDTSGGQDSSNGNGNNNTGNTGNGTGTNTGNGAGTQVQKPTVKKVTLKKVKKTSKKKALKITWKKVNGAEGYEVVVSLNKKFKKAKKYNTVTKTVKGNKASYTIKKLKKSKKFYYVKVRAYKTYKNEAGKTVKVYGKYSKVKKAKTR